MLYFIFMNYSKKCKKHILSSGIIKLTKSPIDDDFIYMYVLEEIQMFFPSSPFFCISSTLVLGMKVHLYVL